MAESALPGQNDEEIGANEDNDEGHKGGENEGDDERKLTRHFENSVGADFRGLRQ